MNRRDPVGICYTTKNVTGSSPSDFRPMRPCVESGQSNFKASLWTMMLLFRPAHRDTSGFRGITCAANRSAPVTRQTPNSTPLSSIPRVEQVRVEGWSNKQKNHPSHMTDRGQWKKKFFIYLLISLFLPYSRNQITFFRREQNKKIARIDSQGSKETHYVNLCVNIVESRFKKPW